MEMIYGGSNGGERMFRGCWVHGCINGAGTARSRQHSNISNSRRSQVSPVKESVDASAVWAVATPRLIDRLAKRRSAAEMQLSVKML